MSKRQDAKAAVKQAKKERDEAVANMEAAIEKVDKFQNELISEYEEMNGIR